MRFAVIANIQANLSALQAALEAIEGYPTRVERILCAGDIVGLGPHPNEVIDLLREREIDAVRGNYDDAVAFERISSGVDFTTNEQENADRIAVDWTRRTLTQANLQYLQNLPRDLRMLNTGGVTEIKKDRDPQVSEYRRSFFQRALFGGLAKSTPRLGRRVAIMHGSPRALNEFVRGDTANSILQAIAGEAQADMMISGHAGTTFERAAHNMIFIGAGSISRAGVEPGDADYVIVDNRGELSIDFGRAPYDPSDHLRAVRELGLPLPLPI